MITLLQEIETAILGKCTFDQMDDAGRVGIAEYMATKVTVGTATMTRTQFCLSSDVIRESFLDEQKLVGAMTERAALTRIATSAAIPKKEPRVITREDLQAAEFAVGRTGLSVLCDP